MKKRESNLELMRVVLMCITPAYHLLVYNLILKAAWNDAMGVTLAFTVAGAIPANYAFMTMSSYFLLEERGGTSLRRFLNTAALTATLYLVRFAVIRGLYGFDSKEYMVEGFITKGAWWYMDSYLILLLLYPFLNRFLRGIGRRAHLALAVALFGLLALFFVLGNMTLPGDLTGFLFIYVTMGYLRRGGYRKFLLLPVRTCPMLLGAAACYFALFAVGFVAKWPGFAVDRGLGNDILQYVISRYNVLAAVMGICVFFFFRCLPVPQSRGINRVAEVTVYVFLLHETVLGVFWYLGFLWFPMEGRPGPELFGWIALFTAVSFGAAFVVKYLYERTAGRFWRRLIKRILETRPAKWMEDMETRL